MKNYKFSFPWIWTHWFIEYFWDQNFETDIKNMVEDFNQKYSRFLPDSVLSKLNFDRQIQKDEDLENMLKLGEKYYFLTWGIFDLFVADELQKIWYGSTYKPGTGLSKIIFEEDKILLTWGQNLDLWGIWKWYLIKKIQNFFSLKNIFSYMINGWGDIAISQKENEIWNIFFQHPLEKDMSVGKIFLKFWAHACSWNYVRNWQKDWQIFHHLIDTKTKTSSKNPFLAVHIVCDDIILADIASTAIFVSPIEKIENLAQKLGVDFFIIFDNLKSVRSKWFPEIF